jgi:hypothetical protein
MATFFNSVDQHERDRYEYSRKVFNSRNNSIFATLTLIGPRVSPERTVVTEQAIVHMPNRTTSSNDWFGNLEQI